MYVGDIPCGKIEYETGKRVYSVDCDIVGRSVKIVNDYSYLTLCEVRVMGRDEPVIGMINSYFTAIFIVKIIINNVLPFSTCFYKLTGLLESLSIT